jgi:lipopolysaccharide export system permease protein
MVMPARLIDLSPFIALLGVVYGLAGMGRAHELGAMRNAGISHGRLCRMCAGTTCILMVGLVGADFLARPLSQQGEFLFMSATSKDGTLFSDSGVWTEMQDGVLHIRALSFAGAHQGLSWYEFHPGGALRRALFAQSATPLDDGAMELRGVVDKSFIDPRAVGSGADPGERSVTRVQQTWRPPSTGRVGYPLPIEQLSLLDLYAQTRQLRDLEKDSGVFGLAFWQRVSLPLSAITFSLFGAGLVLGARPRAGVGAVVGLGVGTAFVLFLLQQFATNALYLLWPAPLFAVLLPIGAMLALAVWLNGRLSRPAS